MLPSLNYMIFVSNLYHWDLQMIEEKLFLLFLKKLKMVYKPLLIVVTKTIRRLVNRKKKIIHIKRC